MNMVSHETIGPDFKAVFLAVFFQPMKILFEVIIIIENGVLIVATLGDMVGIINSYGSCYSWHSRKSNILSEKVNKTVAVPIFSYAGSLLLLQTS